MGLLGPYIHRIDPIIGSLFGVHLWWYGLSYTLGFLNAHLCIQRRRGQLGLSTRAAYTLSLLLAVGVLLGGRLVEVVFYEWPFYRDHVFLIPAYWLGGMATHGLLLGGLVGVWAFSRRHGTPFLRLTDALAIPAAVIMGLGRLGNFIDGQIVGSVTNVWWAVKFPDADGFRHPVVLYDGVKNLLLVPILLRIGKRQPPQGVLTGVFLCLYASLRIVVDVFREYPTTLLGLATGQVLNLLMALLGLGLILLPYGRRRASPAATAPRPVIPPDAMQAGGLAWRRLAFAALLLFSLVLPSDWTQDIPARYGHRHAGLGYSALYPRLAAAPEPVKPKPDARGAPEQPPQPPR